MPRAGTGLPGASIDGAREDWPWLLPKARQLMSGTSPDEMTYKRKGHLSRWGARF